MAGEADCYIALPGGFGTLEELLEMMCADGGWGVGRGGGRVCAGWRKSSTPKRKLCWKRCASCRAVFPSPPSHFLVAYFLVAFFLFTTTPPFPCLIIYSRYIYSRYICTQHVAPIGVSQKARRRPQRAGEAQGERIFFINRK